MASDARSFALVLVMGLPGSGKTSLCQALADSMPGCGHFAFDSLIPDSIVADCKAGRDTPGWKEHRDCLLRALDKILFDLIRPAVRDRMYFSDSDRGERQQRLINNMADSLSQIAAKLTMNDSVLLLDDNFYYASMRHSIFQLARFYECGFGQVHVKVSLSQVKMVNQLRDCPVPAEVLDRMSDRLEAPDAGRRAWEKFSCVLSQGDMGFVDRPGCLTDSDSNIRLRRFLLSCAQNPFRPPADDEFARQQAEQSREVCSLSLLHQADLRLRAIVSDWVAGRSDAGDRQAELGRTAADRKRALMASLRDGKLRVPGELNSYSAERQNELDRFLLENLKLTD